MNARRRVRLAVLAAACAGCQIPNPERDGAVGQSVLELGEAVTALRFEVSVLQDQVDSLRAVVVRQDSALARLARSTGAAP